MTHKEKCVPLEALALLGAGSRVASCGEGSYGVMNSRSIEGGSIWR